MKRLYRDNVAFAYEDVGSGSQPFLFVHGWTAITTSSRHKSSTSAGFTG